MRILKNISLLLLGALVFTSCEEEDKIVYNADEAVAPVLNSPSSSSDLTFTVDDAANTINFSWSAADPGVNVEINYTVEVATDNAFTNAATLISETTDLEDDLTVTKVNSTLVALEMTVEVEATAYFRVVASISDYVDDIVSETVSFTVTPYETVIDYPMIYVPGEYQGWSPGADEGILYSYDSNTTYEGILYLEDSDDDGDVEFKITSEGSWNGTNWGGTLTATDDGYSGTLDASGDNFNVVPGCYHFTVDTDALTIELTETDYWGIIGSSVSPYDWSADVDMTYNGQMQRWEVTEDLVAGEFKFRANDGWDLNYGSDDQDGTLQSSGGNISIGADGNYTITLDTENLTYTVTAN